MDKAGIQTRPSFVVIDTELEKRRQALPTILSEARTAIAKAAEELPPLIKRFEARQEQLRLQEERRAEMGLSDVRLGCRVAEVLSNLAGLQLAKAKEGLLGALAKHSKEWAYSSAGTQGLFSKGQTFVFSVSEMEVAQALLEAIKEQVFLELLPISARPELEIAWTEVLEDPQRVLQQSLALSGQARHEGLSRRKLKQHSDEFIRGVVAQFSAQASSFVSEALRYSLHDMNAAVEPPPEVDADQVHDLEESFHRTWSMGWDVCSQVFHPPTSWGPSAGLLLGHHPESYSSLWLKRSSLVEHTMILGAVGSGKTSAALIPFVRGLLGGSDEPVSEDVAGGSESRADCGPPPPMLVIDLSGDWPLYHATRSAAEQRGRKFRFFTIAEELESEMFDPIEHLARREGASATTMAYELNASLNLIYHEDYAGGYFSGRNSTTHSEAIAEVDPPITLDKVLAQLKRMDREHRKDAMAVYDSLRSLAVEPLRSRLVPGEANKHRPRIDMEQVFEGREVIYAYLPGRALEMPSRKVAKLLISAFMAEGERRHDTAPGTKRQAYIVIDEFQRVVASNTVSMLNDARKKGVAFVMANQSLAQLDNKGDTKFARSILGTVNHKLFFTVPSQEEVELFQGLSGEQIEELSSSSSQYSMDYTEGRGHGESRSSTDTRSKGETASEGLSYVPSLFLSRVIVSQNVGRSASGSQSHAESRAESTLKSQSVRIGATQGSGTQSLYRPALSANEILAASSQSLSFICHSVHKNAMAEVMPDGQVQFCGGGPRIVQGLYGLSEAEFDAASVSPPLRRELPIDGEVVEYSVRLEAEEILVEAERLAEKQELKEVRALGLFRKGEGKDPESTAVD